MSKSTVVSFIPFPLNDEYKPGLFPAHYSVPESDTKTPALLIVSDAFHFVYLDESRPSLRVPNPSNEVARSIVEDFCNSQLGRDENSCPAIFWVEGEFSANRVLIELASKVEEVKVKQKNWFMNICKIADDDWSKNHQHAYISSIQRKAADLLGWRVAEHEWMSPHTTMEAKSCPACGMTNPKGIVVCPGCKCVLDAEKYKELTFA